MSGKFQPINRDTAYLLPPSLQDWLPGKPLAQFVVNIVDQPGLSELTRYFLLELAGFIWNIGRHVELAE